MTPRGWAQIALYFAILALLTRPMGLYLRSVLAGRQRWLAWPERWLYRVAGVDPAEDQPWTRYAAGMLAFSLVSMLVVYLGLRLQQWLPWNPGHLPALAPRQAFETAASFTTNTNWQSYAGETTMSYFSQAALLAFQNFASAAVGIGVAMALVRGLAGHTGGRVGNFWADLIRVTLYVLLPLSLPLALVLVQQGVIQSLSPYLHLTTPAGAAQVLPMGPVASQEAIKQLGTNGGGFFNANAAHPFENPTAFSNFLSMLAIMVIPAGLLWVLGDAVGQRRHGWTLWGAMAALLATGVLVTYAAEAAGNPVHAARGVQVAATPLAPGGNMEGKEVRFGLANSALYATLTTAASCGAVNAMHDSFTPLGGLVLLVNMHLGEVIFGGVGAGLYGLVMMVVLTVFLAGLMVGRTPTYLGKRIRRREVQAVMLYILAYPAIVLPLAALSLVTGPGLAGLANAGPHGLSEVLYAFTSAGANNGSAFAGLNGASPWYNTLLGLTMLVGRFALIVPVLALAGFLGEQRSMAEDAGSFPVSGPLFGTLLVGVIVIVGALTWFPALALGPVVEHLVLRAGGLF